MYSHVFKWSVEHRSGWSLCGSLRHRGGMEKAMVCVWRGLVCWRKKFFENNYFVWLINFVCLLACFWHNIVWFNVFINYVTSLFFSRLCYHCFPSPSPVQLRRSLTAAWSTPSPPHAPREGGETCGEGRGRGMWRGWGEEGGGGEEREEEKWGRRNNLCCEKKKKEKEMNERERERWYEWVCI